MEKSGLVNNFLESSNRRWAAHNHLLKSNEFENLTKNFKNSLDILKEVEKTNSIQTIIEIEQISLTLEMKFHGNSPEERNSIQTGINQLHDAESALRIVSNHEAYKQATETYPSKRREAGLPLDAFREFIKSHSTRLTNRLTAQISIEEKNMLRQRKENLKVAKQLYVEMQRKALGIACDQSKEAGLER